MTTRENCPENGSGGGEPQKNTNIGTLGKRFVQARLDVGMSFDDAWHEWDILHKELLFILVDCPEVKYYDWQSVCDADARLSLRLRAKEALGQHIKSEDVSRLARVGIASNFAIPTPRYEMDENEVREFLLTRANEIELEGDLEIAMEVRSGGKVDEVTAAIEAFANEHSLWAVPPKELLTMWRRSFSQTDQDEGGD